eukprot:m.814214 g.814214  ORF g.814214 m.814214 type:complete len:1145 (-) comp23393_c0_seq1:1230-4664(-)
MEGILQQLAQASAVLASPAASNSDRAAAEQIFQQLKTVSSPLEVYQHVLGRTEDLLIVFQVATVFKSMVAQHVSGMGSAEVSAALKPRLLQWISASTHSEAALLESCRKQMLATLAVMYKRAWILDADSANLTLEQDNEALLHGGSRNNVILLQLLSAILHEFSTGTQSSATGTTMENHLMAKQSFEKLQLRRIFAQSIAAMRHVLSPESTSDGSLARLRVNVLAPAVALCEQVLKWQFTSYKSRRHVGSFQTQPSAFFRGGPEWHDVITPDLFTLFLAAFDRVGSHGSSLALSVRECLVQLATVASVVPTSATCTPYVHAAVVAFLGVVERCVALANPHPGVLLSFGTFAARLVGAFGFDRVAASCESSGRSSGGTGRFVDAMLAFTTVALRAMVSLPANGVAADDGEDGEGCGSEIVNAVLDAWVDIVCTQTFLASTQLHPHVAKVFMLYLEARMAKAQRDALDDDEVQEETAPDEELYDNQLTAAACLGRCHAESSTNGVGALLVAKATALTELIGGSAAVASEDVGAKLTIASEELHWVLLVSGYLMSDSELGERDIVPPQIMQFSAALEADDPSTDPVCHLPAVVLQLLRTLVDAAHRGRRDFVSSVVVADLLWWLARWSRPYLLLKESNYTGDTVQLSMALLTAYGEGADNVAATVDALLDLAIEALVVWSTDTHAVAHAVALLDALTDRRVVQTQLLRGRAMWGVAEGFRDPASPVGTLPAELQTHVAKALCRLCSAAGTSSDERAKLLLHLVEPTHRDLQGVLADGMTTQKAQTPAVHSTVVRTMFVLRGMAQAVTEFTAAMFFGYFCELLPTLVGLLKVYAVVPETCVIIMTLYVDLVSSVAPRLQQGSEQQSLYASTADAIIAFSDNMQRLRESQIQRQQDEFVEHLLLLLELLSAASHVPQFSGDDDDAGTGGAPASPRPSAGAVVLCGLRVLLPMLTPNILAIPDVCQRFYKLVSYVCQEHGSKLYREESVVVPLLQTLGHGLGAYGSDVDKHVLQAAYHLGSTHHACLCAAAGGDCVHSHAVAVQALLVPLHEKVFTAYVLEPFDLALELDAAHALYMLSCCNVAKTKELIEAVLAKQPHGSTVWERLAQAFTAFLSDGGLQFDLSREHTTQFVSNFRELLNNIRGFVLVF